MGLLSSLAGGVLGGLFQKSAEKRQQRYAVENVIESLPRLRMSAEKAGVNMLTAMGASNTGNAGAPAVAPLASASVIQGIVQDASDLLTGETAEQKSRQKVRDKLEKLQLEKMNSGGSKRIIIRTNAANSLPNVTNSPRLGGDRIQITPKNERSRSAGLTSTVKPQDVHVRENYTTSSGETVMVPMGPDIDEVVSGVGIEAAGSIKKMGKSWIKYDQQLKDGNHPLNPSNDQVTYVRDKQANGPKIPKGVTPPDGWALWHPDRRNAWLVRWGHKKP